ncbi:silent information regulator protein Sir2 [Sphaerotilus natans subsp. natans DSM 6575]|uniref:protein acetyllysine N-acetyltransferase n=1 Tax=Sphaerotilus natans subsp. natans DSM 6575 TaxID=1286631 RepID=A0A059KN46_9BURK|nr:Sir2 family NAD-dependent protein deacetylase [Sphaerotilus natans]KDB52902.1 silent information regulator protein Sir2 [Sphaerotilus natans subsp. natans DSM 6575]SIS05207.1 NAD-dependent protein deacetylase, SIR2 family [Sphaerotilus natans]
MTDLDLLLPLIDDVAQQIHAADALVIAAGAGLGVDSGLPDFRGTRGFWRAYPALGRQRLRFQDIASPAAFRRDARIAWGFYGHRLALYRQTVPHEGFALLKRWMAERALGGRVFTSNVDGQFQRAGLPHVHECHGSIHLLQCSRPCGERVWSADSVQPEVDEAQCRLISELPRCPDCGAVARPAILMFDDAAWVETPFERQADALDDWLTQVRGCRLVVLEIGAGSAIVSVRSFAQRLSRGPGVRWIRLNPDGSRLPPGHGPSLQGGALELLRRIHERMPGPISA